MNKKSLIAALALAGCMSAVSVTALAQTPTEPTVPEASSSTTHELKVGDRAPQKYQRPGEAIKNWKAKGLKQPEKESQWVRLDAHYVLLQITNGQILEIVPVKK
ncbi:RcnB family protein [Pseudomonas sp. Pseusp122]|jgi:hypothetical protein|uniref:RcnB family protein n=1 Tax=unclassified Pseudomonas TaxID=196821 RepID=UPI0039A69200